MRRVMQAIEQETMELGRAPFFDFLRDKGIDARRRLAFAPCTAHFVMSFADLYALVLREEPTSDPYQTLVNAHTREDENHWQWFLKDLEKLGANPAIPLSDALRFVWGDATVRMRVLTYQMCRLGFRADSLRKLVLVHVIEAAGKVTIESVSEVGREFGLATGERLVYLGPHHFDTEGNHTIETSSVHSAIEDIPLDADTAAELIAMVVESFGYFRSFVDEMHDFAVHGQALGQSLPVVEAQTASTTMS